MIAQLKSEHSFVFGFDVFFLTVRSGKAVIFKGMFFDRRTAIELLNEKFPNAKLESEE